MATLQAEVLKQKVDASVEKLADAGSHYVIDSVADLPPVIDDINRRLANGEKPWQKIDQCTMWNQRKSHSKMYNSFFWDFGLSISSFMYRAFLSEVISIFDPKLSSFELLSGYFTLVSIVAEKKLISRHFAKNENTTVLLTLWRFQKWKNIWAILSTWYKKGRIEFLELDERRSWWSSWSSSTRDFITVKIGNRKSQTKRESWHHFIDDRFRDQTISREDLFETFCLHKMQSVVGPSFTMSLLRFNWAADPIGDDIL